MSGQGTSVALLGAYILAGELKAAGDDYQLGFANYHAEFHGFVERNQWLVSDNIPVVRRYRRRSSNESCIPSRSRTTERLHPGAARMALVGRFTEPEDLQTKYE